MSLGMAPRQGDLLDDITRFCDAAVRKDSICGLLHRERDQLFPDEFVADMFSDMGRRSVPPSVVAGPASDLSSVSLATLDHLGEIPQLLLAD